MKKNFVRVMLFGALTLAVSTTVTSCKDYDDDIKNLQEQINTITSTSPVSTEDMKSAISSAISTLQTQLQTAIDGKADSQAVRDLLQTVTALQTALDNKADASTIQTLGDRITALSTEVNSIKGNLEEKQAKLEEKVNGLAEQLSKAASSEEVQRLAGELADTKNDLAAVKKMAENNATAIVEIQGSIAQLEALSGRVEALEEFKNIAATKDDLKGYVESSKLNGLIDSEVLAQLNENGSIAKYVKEAVEAAISSTVTSINSRIDGVDAKLSTLSTNFEAYKTEQSLAYQTITTNVGTLESFKNTITSALTKGGYTDFASVLTAISGLETSYNSCITTTSLGGAVDTYLQKCLGDANTEFGKLSLKVKALENQIQSVTYIPEYEDGRVEFITYFHDGKLVAKAQPIKVRFRISPITAVAKFAENYTPVFEGSEIKTRSAVALEDYQIVEGGIEADEKTGIVTFTLSTETKTSYAISLNLEAKDASQNLTDISSNYFPVISDYRTITNVTVISPNGKVKKIYNDNEKSEINYAEGYTLEYEGTDRAGESVTGKIANKYFDVKYDFVKTEGDESWKNYTINEGVLRLTKYDKSITTPVTPKAVVAVMYADGTTSKDSYETEFAKVTPETSSTYTSSVTIGNVEFNAKEDQEIPVTLNKANYRDLGISQEEYEKLELSSFMFKTEGVRFAFYTGKDKTANQLAIIVPKGTKAGAYPLDLVVNVTNVQKFTLTSSATVQVAKNYALVYDTKIANRGSVELLPTFTPADKPSKVEFSFALPSAFGNYDEIQKNADAAGASIIFSLKDDKAIKGVNISTANALTVNNEYESAANTPIVVNAKVIAKDIEGKDVVLSTISLSITLKDISGTWTAPVPTQVAIGKDQLDASINLVEKAEWKYGSKTIWKAGKEVGTGWGASPLAIFGFTAPAITLDNVNDGKYVSLTKEGELKLTDAGKLLKGVNILVTVTVKSHWGVISNGTTHITVKVDNSKDTKEISF